MAEAVQSAVCAPLEQPQSNSAFPTGKFHVTLPVGLQIVSKALHETDILRAAAAFEAARPWSHRKPAMHEPRAMAAAEPARIGT
jgi:hypothetical protein